MIPKLVKISDIVEIDNRRYMATLDCTIENIRPDGTVEISDYCPIRKEPVNLRVNTGEIVDVTDYFTLKGFNAVATKIIRRYTYTNNLENKTILKYINYYGSKYLIFNDNTFWCSDAAHLCLDVVKLANLLSENDIIDLNKANSVIDSLNKNCALNKKLAEAKKLLAEYNLH